MTSIIIYTTQEKLLHKQNKLEDDNDKSDIGEYNWTLSSKPKRLEMKDRIYFATKGFIKGYFLIEDMDIYGGITFLSETWKDIKPIPTKSFQGFKYADKVEGLI